MSTKKTPELTKESILDASTADILAFARDVAGLDFPADAGRDYVIDQVFEALEWDAYRPEADATHVELTLMKTADEKHPYQGGCNGRMFTIKRGERVTIPIAFYNTMLDAASMAYTIEPVTGEDPNLPEGGNAGRRIPRGDLPIRVHRWINRGGAAPKAAAPEHEEAA